MPLKNGRTSAALQQILVGSIIPPGTIQAFGGGTVPSGWLLCDGSTANRSTYSALFSAIGVAHGSGNGSTTFHLPDYRGRFLRGADDMGTGAAGRDPNAGARTAANTGGTTGAGVGSVQDHQVTSHAHTVRTYTSNNNPGTLPYGCVGTSGGGTTNNIGSTGGDETRPQNANVEYIIKV